MSDITLSTTCLIYLKTLIFEIFRPLRPFSRKQCSSKLTHIIKREESKQQLTQHNKNNSVTKNRYNDNNHGCSKFKSKGTTSIFIFCI